MSIAPHGDLPSHENIKGILEAVKGKGLEYFVVDCGWFVEEGVHWSRSMGDYVPSDRLVPRRSWCSQR